VETEIVSYYKVLLLEKEEELRLQEEENKGQEQIIQQMIEHERQLNKHIDHLNNEISRNE